MVLIHVQYALRYGIILIFFILFILEAHFPLQKQGIELKENHLNILAIK